jgi:RNA polymerase sigma-70 factor (ECF subfamily)
VTGAASVVSDLDLVARTVGGDRDAFGLLYDRHASILLAVCVRILRERRDAEDVLQETFIQAWRDADRFDARRCSVRGWLLTLARSRAIDRYRSRRAADGHTASGEDILERAAPESLRETSLVRRLVRQQLERLSVNERKVLTLAYWEGLTQEEIARTLDEPLGTVKSRMRLGLKKLQRFLSVGESGGETSV